VNPADYKLTKELIKAHCDRNNVRATDDL
jgi:hypothetical protein